MIRMKKENPRHLRLEVLEEHQSHFSRQGEVVEVRVEEIPMSEISMGTHREDPHQEGQEEEVMIPVQVDQAVQTIRTMIQPVLTLQFPERQGKIPSDMPRKAFQVRTIRVVPTLIRTRSMTKSL